jgi:CheY-like chemotaxis protein
MQMPDMDGLEATAAIRRQEGGSPQHVPIIAMSVHAISEVREHGLAAGMNGNVVKPTQEAELWKDLKRVVGGAGAYSTCTSQQSPGPADDFDEGAVLDRVAGNMQLLRELVAVFHDDCARLLLSLRAALEYNDPAGVRLTAHTLKGMVSFFAARAATETAYALEKSGADGDLTAGPQRFARLINEIETLQASLSTVTEGKPLRRDEG